MVALAAVGVAVVAAALCPNRQEAGRSPAGPWHAGRRTSAKGRGALRLTNRAGGSLSRETCSRAQIVHPHLKGDSLGERTTAVMQLNGYHGRWR